MPSNQSNMSTWLSAFVRGQSNWVGLSESKVKTKWSIQSERSSSKWSTIPHNKCYSGTCVLLIPPRRPHYTHYTGGQALCIHLTFCCQALPWWPAMAIFICNDWPLLQFNWDFSRFAITQCTQLHTPALTSLFTVGLKTRPKTDLNWRPHIFLQRVSMWNCWGWKLIPVTLIHCLSFFYY